MRAKMGGRKMSAVQDFYKLLWDANYSQDEALNFINDVIKEGLPELIKLCKELEYCHECICNLKRNDEEERYICPECGKRYEINNKGDIV
jgi:Zn finger protein HypA/HybF involved in hydrogenase expression